MEMSEEGKKERREEGTKARRNEQTEGHYSAVLRALSPALCVT